MHQLVLRREAEAMQKQEEVGRTFYSSDLTFTMCLDLQDEVKEMALAAAAQSVIQPKTQ